MTEEIKKRKSLTGFLVPIKLTTKTEGEKERKEKKRGKNPKESIEQVKK